jgi:ATP-dependent protease ClpP protease subunit
MQQRHARITNGPGRGPRATMPRANHGQSWFRIEARAPRAVDPTPEAEVLVGGAPAAPENTSREADVYIYDEIGGWGVYASEFINQLASLDVDQINLHLNSPGGDVFEGSAIYNCLVAHAARIRVVVDGIAASAASYIAMAGDEIVMNPGSMMMIHDASGFCYGPATDMREMAALLDKVSDTIAGIYAHRTSTPATDWRARMLVTTWYTGEEAVAAGLADRVVGMDELEEDSDDAAQDAVTALAKASAWMRSLYGRDMGALPTPTVPRPRGEALTVEEPAPAGDPEPAAAEDDAAPAEDELPPFEDDAAPEGAAPADDASASPEHLPAVGADTQTTPLAPEGEQAGEAQPERAAADEEAPDVAGAHPAPPPADDPAPAGEAAESAPAPAPAEDTDSDELSVAAFASHLLDDATAWDDLVARLVPTSPPSADDAIAALREALL